MCASSPTADGKALVVVAGDSVFSSQADRCAGERRERRYSRLGRLGPRRLCAGHRLSAAARSPPAASRCASIGLAWLRVDNSPRTLTVADRRTRAKILPRQKITIPVTIKGLESGEEAYLTLAAVDEGILQLTDFNSPDPND